MFDAIIVGARCAGSPTAMLLAQRGYRVLLVDRSTFPSDVISTHYIHQPGIERLQRWGLLDAVRASGCPALRRYTFDLGDFALVGAPPPAGDVHDGYAPRRRVLDTILVDAAARAGAEVREAFTVTELRTDGDRVVGIRGHARGGGRTVVERARMVIGADGLHSLVAARVEAQTYRERPSLTCNYYSYWSGVPSGVALCSRPHRVIFSLPTNDGLTLLAVQWPRREFHEFRRDIEGNFLTTLDLVPSIGELARAGRREERFVGTAEVPNLFRRPYGDGWALVGDAGYHKDPQTGQGITDAFRDAELLSGAIHSGWSGERPLPDALAAYERERNHAVTALYDFTCQLATLDPPSAELQRLFQALQGNQRQIDRFWGTLAGTVPLPEFFSPENVTSILRAAEPAQGVTSPTTREKGAA